MSIKALFNLLDRFPPNLGNLGDEQGERCHQDIKVMKEKYQGKWDAHVMAISTAWPHHFVAAWPHHFVAAWPHHFVTAWPHHFVTAWPHYISGSLTKENL